MIWERGGAEEPDSLSSQPHNWPHPSIGGPACCILSVTDFTNKEEEEEAV